MRNIWRIFARDVRNAVGNVIGVIVVIGLVVVPALYAWFNIAASWDPYSNTSELKVAVASDDEGYKSDLIPVKINVGETVTNTLRANDQLDWQFVKSDRAVDGVRSGEYYAAIVIPKSFSADMMTLFSPKVKHAKLLYYTNEKANAIAPHVTDTGATTITTQIDSTFAKTVGQVELDLVGNLFQYMQSDQMQSYVANATKHIGSMADQLNTAADQTSAYSSLLGSTGELISSTDNLITTAGDGVNGAKKSLDQAKTGIDSLDAALSGTADTLNTALADSERSYDAVNREVDSSFDAIGRQANVANTQLGDLSGKVKDSAAAYGSLADSLKQVQRQTDDTAVKDALGRSIDMIERAQRAQSTLAGDLGDAANTLTGTTANVNAKRSDLKRQIVESKSSVTKARDTYESGLKPKLTTLAGSIADVGAQSRTVAESLKNTMRSLDGVAGGSADSITRIRTMLNDSAKQMTTSANRLHDLGNRLTAAYNGGSPKELAQLRQFSNADADSLATLLSSPVSLNRVSVYHIENYGSAMAPFYTILSIWVGAIVLVAMMKVQLSDRAKAELGALPAHAGLRLHEEYFGRYLFFLLLALCQGLLVGLGDLYYLEIQVRSAWQFILVCLVAAVVFSNITYTLTLSFGDIGKAMAVVLLVMQVAGSGGTFPMEVLPGPFKALYPFLLFPHGIAAMHAAIAGSYGNEYWVELGILALFLVPSLLLGLVLRKPVIRLNDWIIRNLESTKLM
ncbi:ABC-2 family transporter protein [Bifidobacterium margollesii]|uniref:ABC-2 family transporter protein n=1 Tax=Bifidobacterium margollesii TaxID=2020964 RepID=A0A2N5JD48_9BIFI|nr:YhgE/Pip domain-containing protein [Bifidobacterium margollesii]PLS32134.1 ABC-2 family transporter protein [Bifidobacterium margollesii]